VNQILNSVVVGVVATIVNITLIGFSSRSRRGRPFIHDVFKALSLPAYILIWVIAAAAIAEIWVDDAVLDEWLYRLRLLAVVVVVVTFLIRLQKRVERRMRESIPFDGMREEAGRTAGWGRFVAFTVLVIGSLVALQVLGINVSSVIAFGGFGALAVGIAGRELFANLFGGRMLYLTRSFLEGERIRVPKEKIEGTIQRIGWYQTTLLVGGEAPITIPNAFFMSQVVINDSRAKWEEKSFSLRLERMKPERFVAVMEQLVAVVDRVELLSLSKNYSRLRLYARLKGKKKEKMIEELFHAVEEVVGDHLISLALE
jgi:MscS family membrane protein